jgi:hypothetical protein
MVMETWRTDKQKFIATIAEAFRLYYTDFRIVRMLSREMVEPYRPDDPPGEWHFRIVAARDGEQKAFAIPDLVISREIILDSQLSIITSLIYRMIESVHTHLTETDRYNAIKENLGQEYADYVYPYVGRYND